MLVVNNIETISIVMLSIKKPHYLRNKAFNKTNDTHKNGR